ncbi:Similar to hypothetical protein [Tuber melanosporum Mel28]; acc. no. XP_002840059 [Pyronema omphalodes CBS 100304]|uniref:Uncharacterized protein n=1 Tax=Pyronema omphalodes (strain CBS 100304) TaxID=1076935 RepID=U4KV60_PYROM|nr:Similar to hypothetical protein [Tuber melanosporum Mel28]; acc. no. XP_002840059 [Pyronema omphalodes CBS 100304]
MSTVLTYGYQPQDVELILGMTKWFWMPTNTGDLVRAVSVNSAAASYWISGYTLINILIFVAIARIIKDIIIAAFPLRGNGNRYAMLVGYYNTNDQVSVIITAFSYCWKCLVHIKGDGLWGIDWGTFGLGISLVLFASALLVTNSFGSIYITGQLRLGNVARVAPQSIYYPDLNYAPILEQPSASHYFQSPACIRSTSELSEAKVILKDSYKFLFSREWVPGKNASESLPSITFDYRYTIKGHEFGFQRAPDLEYKVHGTCKTEYSFFDKNVRGQDQYILWDDRENHQYAIDPENYTLPFVEFINFNQSHTDIIKKFAMLPHTVGRRSSTENLEDPWYLTEQNDGKDSDYFGYKIKTGRPPIVCQQSDTWGYRGGVVHSVTNLEHLVNTTGLKMHKLLWRGLLQAEFAYPSVLTVGQTLGYSALAVSSNAIPFSGRFEVKNASIREDLERIVLSTLVYSRDVLRTMALIPKERRKLYDLPNLLAEDGVHVPDEVADFVIRSANVTTMSVKALIATPIICLVLWIFIAMRGSLLFADVLDNIRNDSYRSRFVQRTIALSSIQLYRYLDEQLSGERRWSGRLSFTPYIKDVSGRYARQVCEFEVIPVSACITVPEPAITPPLSSRSTSSSKESSIDIESQPSFQAPNLGRRATEFSRPFRTPYARPALVPVYEHSMVKSSKDVRDAASCIRTAEYRSSGNRYELAMTRYWRPNPQRSGGNVGWGQIQKECE